ncbi:MAG: hypothetical protein ACKO7P_08215 [Bacteroidota bacterium]
MNSATLKIGNARGFLSNLNTSIALNLSMFTILFIYLMTEKNHTFKDGVHYHSEFVFGVILLVLMTFNYILFLRTSSIQKTSSLNRIVRHTLNIGFMVWMVLAVSSHGAIGIVEICPALFLFFLLELFQTLNQKTHLLKVNSKINSKLIFLSTFTFVGIIMLFFYFVYNLSLSPLQMFIYFSVYGIYSSLIFVNVYQFFLLVIRRKVSDGLI